MRQISIIASVSILAFLVGSCSGEDSSQQSVTTPAPTPSAAPTTQATTPNNQPFSKPPLVAQQPTSVPKPPANLPVVSGLVQSTNPDARAQQVAKGRKDPFAVIPTQPTITVEAPEVAPARQVPELPSFPEIPSFDTGIGGQSTAQVPRGNSRPTPNPNQVGQTPVNPSTKPNRPAITLPPGNSVPTFKPQLPTLPEPTLARGVEVTGVIQVGDVPQAIVKAPNEASSRYVRAGQRLSNGQVLVKRIEMGDATSPIVIFEQYGVEVAKRVGEKATPAQPSAPTAVIPAPSANTNIPS